MITIDILFNIYTFSTVAYILAYKLLCRKSFILNKEIYRLSQNQQKIFAFVLIFGFVLCLRDLSVGTDTRHYAGIFKAIANANRVSEYVQFSKMPAYVYLARILSFITQDPRIMIIVSGLTTLICTGLFIYYDSPNILFSVILYLFLDLYMPAFNIARQALAMSIIFISYLCLERKKYSLSIVYFVIAVMFHRTAIVAFIMFVFHFLHYTKKKLLLIQFLIIAAEFALIRLIPLFLRWFPIYSNFENAGFSITGSDSGGNRIYTALVIIVIEILGYNNIHKIEIEKFDRFCKLLCISNVGVFSMIIYRHFYLFARIEKYYYQFLIILIPMCIDSIKTKKYRTIVLVGTIGILFIPYILKINDYLPYMFMWSN